MVAKWTRWFAWYPVKLQNGECYWLREVEYEQYRTQPITGAFAGGSRIITHYRLPDDAPEFRME